MTDIIFFTGFPGFLGSELLPRVLERSPGTEAVCLVQPKFADLARRRAMEIAAAHPHAAGRIRIVDGDITQPDLGPDDALELAADVVEIFHLAAVYDLSVGREFAMKVNVEGTRHMLDFAKRCPRLRRFQYVSTCYVSGRFQGVFTEDHLEEGQRFNNFYEETKYLAELEVQRAMRAGLPVSIYRPSVVVGDSRSGATQKFDGPYFVIQWLLRQPKTAVLPVVGDATRYEFNVVPREYVIGAIDHLSARDDTSGAVFNLADPNPLTVDATIDTLAEATGRRVIRIPLPLKVAKAAIDWVPGVYALMRIPSSAVDYFVHPARYGTAKTQAALAGSGVECPHLRDYADNLVSFVRAHPEIGSKAMV
jgi:thioester reductase-like protein